MSTCLVTRLQEAVTDTDLLRLGEVRVKFIDNPKYSDSHTNENKYKLTFIGNQTVCTVTLVGDAYFYDINTEASLGTSQQFSSTSIYLTSDLYIYNPSGTDFELVVSGKYNNWDWHGLLNPLAEGGGGLRKMAVINIDELFPIYTLRNPETYISGNINTYFSQCAVVPDTFLSATTFYINDPRGMSNTEVTGNILQLPYLSRYRGFTTSYFNALDPCDITTLLSKLTSLTSAPILSHSTYLTGDISTARLSSTCTGSTAFALDNVPNICGDICIFIANISSKFRSVSLQSNSNFTGNLGIIPNNIVFISNKDYTTVGNSGFTYTKSASRTHMLACEYIWITSGLDDFLNDMAELEDAEYSTSAWYYRIALYGTRTSASDAAISTLTAKGWTVSVTAR